LAVMLVVLIPFAIWYYESDNITDIEDDNKGRCSGPFWTALAYTCLGFVVFMVLLLVLWSQIGQANIPVTLIAQHYSLVLPVTNPMLHNTRNCLLTQGCQVAVFSWVIPVTFPVYLMAFLSFIGWFFFSTFVGVGFMALPLDLIYGFVRRPKPMSTKVYFEERTSLGQRANKLIKVGEKMEELIVKGESRTRRQKLDDSRNIRTLEKHYYLLKKDLDILNIAHKLKGGNPLWYFMLLFNGIVSIVLSVTWILHMCIFMIPTNPQYTFLNAFFIILENAFGSGGAFPLLGIVAFAIYSFYLMACAAKGNFKLGIRFLFWKIYPMEVNNTLMNAFLVNTWVLLLVSVPTVQFSAFAFPIYVRYTSIDMLFGVQSKFLTFFRYFWVNNVFIWWMLVVALLTTLYLSCRPRDDNKAVNEEIARFAAEKYEGSSI